MAAGFPIERPFLRGPADGVQMSGPRFWDRHGLRLLSGVSAAFFWNVSHRALIYTVLPEIVGEGAGSSAGAIVFAIAIFYSLRMGLSGLESSGSVHSVRRTVLSSVLVFAAIPLVPAGLPMLAMFGVLGFSGGSHFVRAGELVSNLGSSRGRGFALQEASALMGLLSGSLFVGLLADDFSWRILIWLWAGVGLLIWALTWAMPNQGSFESADEPLRNWRPTHRALAFTAVNAAIAANTIGFASVMPTLLVRSWGLTTSGAGLWLGGVRVLVTAGLLTTAVVAQHALARRSTVLSILAVVAITTPLLSLLPANPLLLVALGVEMLLMHHLMPAGWGYASIKVEARDRRRTFAFMGLFGSLLGSAVLAPLVLFVADMSGSFPALALVSAVNIVALGGLLTVGPLRENAGPRRVDCLR